MSLPRYRAPVGRWQVQDCHAAFRERFKKGGSGKFTHMRYKHDLRASHPRRKDLFKGGIEREGVKLQHPVARSQIENPRHGARVVYHCGMRHFHGFGLTGAAGRVNQVSCLRLRMRVKRGCGLRQSRQFLGSKCHNAGWHRSGIHAVRQKQSARTCLLERGVAPHDRFSRINGLERTAALENSKNKDNSFGTRRHLDGDRARLANTSGLKAAGEHFGSSFRFTIGQFQPGFAKRIRVRRATRCLIE